MAKPFSIQAPEDIAKEYAGNKQKIAQAAQMGIVDPTAAVLAGMFIDRMRSAQVMEAAQQPTVAQQVLGGGGLPTPAGPGAMATLTPPSPPMQAPMGAPPAPPMETPMGMADGGLAGLPVPDTMFDEPDNGGYAGGGLVAFAGGGDTVQADPLAWLYSPITSTYGQRRSTGKHSGQDFALRDKTPIGAPAPGRVEKVARDDVNGNFVVVRHPDGTTSSYSHLSAPSVKEGDEIGTGQVIGLSGNTGRVRGKGGGYHLHFGARDAEGNRIDPTSFFKQIAPQVASGKFQPAIPERDIGSAEGRTRSVEDEFARLQKLFGPTAEEAEVDAARMARAKEMASDEYYEKQRKDSMWETLANIGFNMASSKSPYLLQAIGEAAAASMPGARADKKERKALKDRALDVMSAMNGKKRSENLQLYGIAVDAVKTSIQQEQSEAKLALDERQVKVAEDRLKAEIDAAAKAGADPEKVAVSYILNYGEGTPQYEAAKRYYELRYGERGGGASGTDAKAKLEELRGQQGGGTEGAVAPGTIQEGYRFKGGDPAVESNWEKVG